MPSAETKTAAASPSRILVVRVGAIGDTLMVTPLVRMLCRRYPGAEVDFLSSGLAAPLLELNPHLTKLFRLQGRNMPLALSFEKRRLVREFRRRDYDLAILLESAPRYRALLKSARLRQIRSFEEVPFDPGMHAIVNNLAVAGIHDVTAGDLGMDLPLAAEDEAAAARVLEKLRRPRVGIHIGWGPQGRKRRQAQRQRGWCLANFHQLIHSLLSYQSMSIILTGSREDRKDTELLCRQISEPHVRSIAGQTSIRELAAVIKRLDLLISVDSGPCHMAAALGTPLVVLWGPGRIEQTRPLSNSAPVRVLRHQVPCAPCQSTPLQKTCRRNLCMEQISPEEVLEATRSLLYPPTAGTA